MLSLHAAVVVLALSAPGGGQTVLLDFYADWCGPCRGMDSTVHELAAKGYPVRRVNVDQEKDLAQRFGVQTIPCFVMIVNGREAGRVVGGTSLGRLEQLCSLGRSAAAPAPAMLAAPARPPIRPAVATAGPASGGWTPGGPTATATGVVPASWPAAIGRPAVSDAALLAASVRLRVEDPQGHSCGSGTIIDYRPGGEALIVTCGHLFRDSKGSGRIEIDLFGPVAASHVPARLVAYDYDPGRGHDIAFVAFQPQGQVTVARVAPPGYRVEPGDPVISVGCNNGDNPTVQHSKINGLNRFLGPANIEVAGQPIEGRSGGGLFSADGLVIGVCNAADPSDRQGLFAGLGFIQSALDEQGLTTVYKRSPIAPAAVPAGAAPETAVAATDPFARRSQEIRIEPATRTEPAAPAARVPNPDVVAAPPGQSAPLDPGEQAAMDELHQRRKGGAEIVCIIRNCQDPQSKSEIITIERASPALVNQLTVEARESNALQRTSLAIPKARTPLLEWDAEKGWSHREPLPAVSGQ